MASLENLQEQADRAKRSVALTSVLASIVLTLAKLGVGLATGSLGILADAAHSGLDLVAALLTLLAVRVSGRPADIEHNYGHGKVESLSALGETLLLLGTCAWIVYEALRRLLGGETHVEVSIWAFAMMALAICVDVFRSRALLNAARKYHSQALEADALNFTTDLWSSAAVIAGLLLVLIGQRLGIPWLTHADAIAALVVAAIVARVSLDLGRRTLDDLIDTVPSGLLDQVTKAARVPGVMSVNRVRVRRSGPNTFADVTVAVPRAATFEEADAVAGQAEEAIRAAVPDADVVVHADPLRDENEDVIATVRLIAARRGLGAHNIRVSRRGVQRSLELDVEVNSELSVGQADSQVEAFEEDLRRALPDLDRVAMHTEPAAGEVILSRASREEEQRVRDAVQSLRRDGPIECRPSNIEISRDDGRLDLSFDCLLDPNIPLTQAHEMAEEFERTLRNNLPELGRVIIHVEPSEDET